MKNFVYKGVKNDKKLFLVTETSEYTGCTFYRLKDEDGYNLLNNNMVGNWKSYEEIINFIKNTTNAKNNLEFYKRIYEESDKWVGKDINELNKLFQENEKYTEITLDIFSIIK